VGAGMLELNHMKTWTYRLGHSKLRSFTDEQGCFWLEQNPDEASKWAKLARKGHEIAWEFAEEAMKTELGPDAPLQYPLFTLHRVSEVQG